MDKVLRPNWLESLDCRDGGGTVQDKRFSPNIKKFWDYLHYHKTFSLREVATRFDVHHSTIRRWLKCFENMGWYLVVATPKGIRVKNIWGVSHNRKHNVSKDVKRRVRISKGNLMAQVRHGLNQRMKNTMAAQALTSQLGKALYEWGVATDDLQPTINALLYPTKIHTPRWVATRQDAHRWARSLLRKCWEDGVFTWSRMLDDWKQSGQKQEKLQSN
jgi:transposase-like protein